MRILDRAVTRDDLWGINLYPDGYDGGRWKELSLAEQMGNSWGTDAKKMMRYYDGFAMLGRGL